MILPNAPKFSTKLIGNCIKQLAANDLIREASEKDKGKKGIICGHNRYVLTDLAERSIKELILSMRDQFPDESAADIRSSTLSFLCIAKIGDMQDKKLAVCNTVLDCLCEANLW